MHVNEHSRTLGQIIFSSISHQRFSSTLPPPTFRRTFNDTASQHRRDLRLISHHRLYFSIKPSSHLSQRLTLHLLATMDSAPLAAEAALAGQETESLSILTVREQQFLISAFKTTVQKEGAVKVMTSHRFDVTALTCHSPLLLCTAIHPHYLHQVTLFHL